MLWTNEINRALQIQFPVIQAPMLGITTPEMVAAISNSGGLGSLPIGGLSPSAARGIIRKTRSLTDKPFAVNFFAHSIPPVNIQQMERMQDFLEKLCVDDHLPYIRKAPETFHTHSYKEQIEILISEKIPVVSFTFGIPDDEDINALKNMGTILIGTATSVKEALLLEKKEIDIICAQGCEAGGHRGSFLEDEPLPLIGTFSLVPQITRQFTKPVLAAGGIFNGKTIKAAFVLGAQGVQIGTAFIACNESMAAPSWKTAIQRAPENENILTMCITGRWARGIRNRLITAIENSDLDIPAFPWQGLLTAQIRTLSKEQDNFDFAAMWAGQSFSHIETKPAVEIFKKLIEEAEQA